jgi:hypothetical protein
MGDPLTDARYCAVRPGKPVRPRAGLQLSSRLALFNDHQQAVDHLAEASLPTCPGDMMRFTIRHRCPPDSITFDPLMGEVSEMSRTRAYSLPLSHSSGVLMALCAGCDVVV